MGAANPIEDATPPDPAHHEFVESLPHALGCGGEMPGRLLDLQVGIIQDRTPLVDGPVVEVPEPCVHGLEFRGPVVVADPPRELRRGHGEDQAPARRQQARRLPDRADVVRDVLKHALAVHSLVAAGGQRGARRIGADDRAVHVGRVGHPRLGGHELESVERPVRAEDGARALAGAATEIEHGHRERDIAEQDELGGPPERHRRLMRLRPKREVEQLGIGACDQRGWKRRVRHGTERPPPLPGGPVRGARARRSRRTTQVEAVGSRSLAPLGMTLAGARPGGARIGYARVARSTSCRMRTR